MNPVRIVGPGGVDAQSAGRFGSVLRAVSWIGWRGAELAERHRVTDPAADLRVDGCAARRVEELRSAGRGWEVVVRPTQQRHKRGQQRLAFVMREAFYATRRFDDFARRLELSSSSLAARLRSLVADGLLERVPYQEEGARVRHEYALTAAMVNIMARAPWA